MESMPERTTLNGNKTPNTTTTASTSSASERSSTSRKEEDGGKSADVSGAAVSSIGVGEERWELHTETNLLYNPVEQVFFDPIKQQLLLPDDVVASFEAANKEEAAAQAQPSQQQREPDEGESAEVVADDLTDTEKEEDDEDVDIDLEVDLRAGTAALKGTAEGKAEMEDRHVTRLALPVHVVTEDALSLCYYSAVFDGHDGPSCAQYAAAHLHKNIVSLYRQIYSTCKRRRLEREEAEEKLQLQLQQQQEPFSCFNNNSKKRRKKQQQGFCAESLLQQLNDGERSERDEERKLSVAVEALVKACAKAFQITDHNYLDCAKRAGAGETAGSTVCAVMLFGPDDDGQLKIITAHAGDSRAILCRNEGAVRLTEDHKPNEKKEMQRIVRNGGKVMRVGGVWRVVSMDKQTNRVWGLATSRSLGDSKLKSPQELVSARPTIHIYSVDFNEDLFLVLATDGVWDVLTDEEVVAIVSNNLKKSPEDAAQCVVSEAEKKGSIDDKTCNVLYFGWRRDYFSSAECLQEQQPHEEPNAETLLVEEATAPEAVAATVAFATEALEGKETPADESTAEKPNIAQSILMARDGTAENKLAAVEVATAMPDEEVAKGLSAAANEASTTHEEAARNLHTKQPRPVVGQQTFSSSYSSSWAPAAVEGTGEKSFASMQRQQLKQGEAVCCGLASTTAAANDKVLLGGGGEGVEVKDVKLARCLPVGADSATAPVEGEEKSEAAAELQTIHTAGRGLEEIAALPSGAFSTDALAARLLKRRREEERDEREARQQDGGEEEEIDIFAGG